MHPRIYARLNPVVKEIYDRIGEYDYDKYVQYTPERISDVEQDGLWNYH